MEISKLKSQVSIDALLRYYGWNGETGWGKKITCPFHKQGRESNPSAQIKGQRVTCYTCGVSGDILDIVQQQEGTDLKGALEWIRRRFRIS